MNLAYQLLLGFGLMVLLSMILGSSTRRDTSSIVSFFWGDNDLKPSHGIHLLLSSPFSMNGIMYQAFLGYAIGWAAVLLQVIWCLSYILMALYGKKIAALARTGTLHGNIGRVFGAGAERAAAVASIIGFTLQVGWELIVGVSIFSIVAPGNVTLQGILIFALAGIGAIYTILGGLRGNVRANMVQNYIGGVALWVVVLFLMFNGPGAGPASGDSPWDGGSMTRLVTVLTVGGLISNAIFSLVWQFVDMSTWQNLAATDDKEDTPKRVLYWSSLWVFIFPGVVGTMAGMYMRSISGLDSNNLVPHLVDVLARYPVISVFVAAGFVAAMLSTIDGLLLAASQALTWDLFHHRTVTEILRFRQSEGGRSALAATMAGVPDADEDVAVADAPPARRGEAEVEAIEDKERKVLDYTRYWVLLLAAVGAGITFWLTTVYNISIFDLVYIVVVAQMVLVPTVLSVLFWSDRPRRFGTASIVVGLVSGIALVWYGIHNANADLLAYTPAIALGLAFIFWLPNFFTSAKAGGK